MPSRLQVASSRPQQHGWVESLLEKACDRISPAPDYNRAPITLATKDSMAR